MISHDQASRIASSVTVLRPDWPHAQIVTLCTELKNWSLIDLTVGLVYVALDRKGDGSWASKSPYRVKEQGPWRIIGVVDPDLQAQRDREQQRIQADADARALRIREIAQCRICDEDGRIPSGKPCTHDARSRPGYRSAGAARARQTLAAARAARAAHTPEETRA